MRDGKAVILVKDGEAVGISTNAALDRAYKKLFEEANEKSLNSGDREWGICVVLFGTFWIEALVNEYLGELLKSRIIPKSVGAEMWGVLKRSNITQKVRIMASFSKTENAEKTKTIATKLDKLTSMRNRLVHFKDSDTVVVSERKTDGKNEPAEKKNKSSLVPVKKRTEAAFRMEISKAAQYAIQDLPEPPLNTELVSPSIDEYASDVLNIIAFLNDIHNKLSKSKLVFKADKSSDGIRP